MNQRERILACAIGAIAALYVGHWLYQANYAEPLLDRAAEIDRLREDVSRRELDMARFRKANLQLKRWQTQSCRPIRK